MPEAHTDFIFAIIVEELGAIVGILIILGYGIMLYRILKISKEAETLRGSIISYGTFLFLLFHILSYGGSFNMNILMMLFVVQRVSIESKTIKSRKDIANL